jgi:propanediol dehydratase small subunit
VKPPLYRHAREAIALRSGRPVAELSLANLRAGRVAAGDLGIHEQTLRLQAGIAAEAGFAPLARNLERAAELTRVPDAKVLEIYEALRRGADRARLQELARVIEQEYGATATAAFLREAAASTR